jgi:hypothetical protein
MGGSQSSPEINLAQLDKVSPKGTSGEHLTSIRRAGRTLSHC